MLKLRRAGFNRISMGVQSANDDMLRKLGRLHDFARAEQAVADARAAGFKNISIDLMYGLPSQTRDDWANTLNRAMMLNPDHISCYGLKIAEGTELYIFKDSPFLPDDDMQADMYLYAVETLSRFGYRQYEISNFARRGYESRHNLKYWQGEEYLGFGAAAHSYVGGKRFNYIADIDRYCDNVVNGDTIVDQTEIITKFERASEYIMLGMRTIYGISEKEYRAMLPADFTLMRERLEMYERNGYAIFDGERWHLTPKGFLVSNTIITDLLDAQTSQRAASVRPWQGEAASYQGTASLSDKTSREVPLFHGI